VEAAKVFLTLRSIFEVTLMPPFRRNRPVTRSRLASCWRSFNILTWVLLKGQRLLFVGCKEYTAGYAKRLTPCRRKLQAAAAPAIALFALFPVGNGDVIVELISATTTETCLTVRCELDTGQYPSGIVVSDAEMAA
jgi:hypothetical protein